MVFDFAIAPFSLTWIADEDCIVLGVSSIFANGSLSIDPAFDFNQLGSNTEVLQNVICLCPQGSERTNLSYPVRKGESLFVQAAGSGEISVLLGIDNA